MSGIGLLAVQISFGCGRAPCDNFSDLPLGNIAASKIDHPNCGMIKRDAKCARSFFLYAEDTANVSVDPYAWLISTPTASVNSLMVWGSR